MPATVLPSGAVQFMPQEHTTCGHCNASFIVCQCEGLPYGNDYVLVDLPPPPRASTPAQLIRRWCSLISMSTTMGTFNVDRWYQDNCQTLVASLHVKSQQLKEMVDEYVQQLGTDRTLTPLAEVLGGPGIVAKPQSKQIQAVESEAKAALAIFIAGDWSCLTYLGVSLLNNAFQLSDPNKYSVDDTHLQTIYEMGIGWLSSVLGRGYSDHGRALAMEMGRRPVIPAATNSTNGASSGSTTTMLKSATSRLNSYASL